jgi:periplasmic protein TonB
MAYADIENRKVKPAGLAVAMLLNGAAIGALLLAAPQIVKSDPYQTTIAEEVVLERPKKDEPEAKRTPPPEVRVAQITRVDQPPVPVPYQPPIVEPEGGSDTGGLIRPPSLVEPVAPVLPVHVPILKSAKPDPRYAERLQPDYPPTCARAEIEGSVTVKVRIAPNGRVSAVEVLRSDHEEFSRVTREAALRKWRFIAATRDGEGVESWKEMTVRFQMPN